MAVPFAKFDVHRIPTLPLVLAAMGFYAHAIATGMPAETIDWNTRLAGLILIAGMTLPLGYGPGAVRLIAVVALWLGWSQAFLMFTIVANLSAGLIGPVLVRAGVLREVTMLPFAALGLTLALSPWHRLLA